MTEDTFDGEREEKPKRPKIESPKEIRRRLTGTEEPTEELNLLAIARILHSWAKRVGLIKDQNQ
jgi:hypothetical protein